ncbi:unnamed protein product [Caretta caretta]
MYETQAALVTLLPLLLFKLFQVVGDVTVNCTVEVQVPRNYQYQGKPGDSLSIECPVKYCTEKPAIKWCLIQEMKCLLLKDGPTRRSVWREGNVAVLNFMSIQQSNSGLYRCRAVVGSLSHESHAIRVIVRETTDFIPMTREPQVLPGNLADNVVVSSVTGYRAVLSCSNMSLVNLISAVWKIRLRDGACCLLAYRADLNKTVRTNCSERMDWAARPDHDPTLQIHPVRLSDEGYYMCEIANIDGSLHQNYTLSVLVSDDDPAHVVCFKNTFTPDLTKHKEGTNVRFLKIVTALDPRFKNLKFLPKSERDEVWSTLSEVLKEQHSDEETTEPEPPKNKINLLLVSSDTDNENEHVLLVRSTLDHYRAEPIISLDA